MPDGFRIATGYVEIETHYDQDRVTRAAEKALGGSEREGKRSGLRTGFGWVKTFGKGLFTEMPALAKMLPDFIPGVFATPIGAAAGAVAALFLISLAGAILGSGILLALGGGIAAAIAYGLKDNPKVKAAATSLKDKLQKALKDAAAPLAPSLISGLKVFEGYVPGFGEKLKTIFSFMDLESLGSNFAQMIDAFLAPLTDSQALSGFSQFMRDAGDQLPRIGKSLGEFFAILMKYGPVIADAFGVVVSIFGFLLKWLAYSIVYTSSWLLGWAAIWHAVQDVVMAVWNAIKAAFSASLTWIKNAWNTSWGAVKSFFSSIWSGIQGAYNSAKNALQSAFGAMGNWLRNTWNSLWSGIKSFFSSIWSGITGVFNSVRSTVSGIASGLASNVRSAIGRLASIPGQVGGYFSSMVSTIGRYIGNAVSTVRGLPGKITSAVGNLGSLLYNAGKQIIQGLINGINNMIGSLKSKLSGITSMLPDWKGPMSVDMRILEPSGQAIMQGFMKGIDKKVPGLRDQLKGVTNDLGAQFNGRPGGGASPAPVGGPQYNFAPGSVVLDASKIKDIQSLIDMINSLNRTSRQWGAKPTLMGV